MKIMTEVVSSLERQKIMGKEITNSNVGFQITCKLRDDGSYYCLFIRTMLTAEVTEC
jgi:hypothetical protein